MQHESVDLRQDPADASVSSTDQNPESVKLLEQAQTGGQRSTVLAAALRQ